MKICIVGLGYVGFPLFINLSKYYDTYGLDNDVKKVVRIQNGINPTGEFFGNSELDNIAQSNLYARWDELPLCDIYIVTVPTPVDADNMPDLSILKTVSENIGLRLRTGNIVIYESTVYPSVTEEICVKILSETSGLQLNQEFGVGYSPERISPGDSTKTLESVVKVVAASSDYYLDVIDDVYKKIIPAGTFRANSIQVAEAAKVLENTQRDVNIALMNEIFGIFSACGIETNQVLKAARTKWNFLPFYPGLVGGHCIGVDPYYLIKRGRDKSSDVSLLTTAREINEGFSTKLISLFIKKWLKLDVSARSSDILILGATFKENVSDQRNSKVYTLIRQLEEYNFNCHIFDPLIDKENRRSEFNYVDEIHYNYSNVFLLVPHDAILNTIQFENFCQIEIFGDLYNRSSFPSNIWQ